MSADVKLSDAGPAALELESGFAGERILISKVHGTAVRTALPQVTLDHNGQRYVFNPPTGMRSIVGLACAGQRP
jgi:hypothetical protein